MNQENKQGFSSETITTKLEYIHPHSGFAKR